MKIIPVLDNHIPSKSLVFLAQPDRAESKANTKASTKAKAKPQIIN